MAEYSLVRIRKGRLEELIEQGNTGASLVLRMVGSLDAYLNVAQLGNTVTSLALGWFGGRLLVDIFYKYLPLLLQDLWTISIFTVVCAFAVLLCLQVVLGEFMPRILALGKVEKVSLFVARPLYLFYIVTYPLSVIFSRISKALLQLFGIDPVPDADITHSEDELRMIVSASERGGVLDHVESRLIDNVFDFADRVAREVMVPRQDMIQRPPTIRGLSLRQMEGICGATPEETEHMAEWMGLNKFLDRSVNEGFSGGEIKRSELLQLMAQKPELLLLDEPESGVDVENIALVGRAANYILNSSTSACGKVCDRPCCPHNFKDVQVNPLGKSNRSGLIITHLGHILKYVPADTGHIVFDGTLACSGDPEEMLSCIGQSGYEHCIHQGCRRWKK